MADPLLPFKEGVRLPSVIKWRLNTHGTRRPDCVMRVVTVNPKLKSSMPVVSVDQTRQSEERHQSSRVSAARLSVFSLWTEN